MRRGTEVKLTPTEWHLVEALVRRPSTLVPGAPRHFTTEPGLGYRFEP
jgi:two-component system KDP operon response regulator KdpE